MRVTAIIPNWNGGEKLAQMLDSVARQEGISFERVVVIDNNSSDAPELVTERLGFEIVKLDRNHGFSKAVNCGIDICVTPWVAILNNDIVLAPDWLLQLSFLEAASDYLGSKLLQLSNKGLIDGGFDLVSRSGLAWRAGHNQPDAPLWAQPRTGCIVPLTAALFRKDVFDRIGTLDERFGSYLEDVDLGLRCIAAGLRGRYVPTAVAWHAGSATLGPWSADMVRLLSRNQALIARKHLRDMPMWPKLVGQALWGLLALKRGTGLAWLRGKIDGLQEKIVSVPCRQAVAEFVLASEQEIAALQAQSRSDGFWKAYFLLTGFRKAGVR